MKEPYTVGPRAHELAAYPSWLTSLKQRLSGACRQLSRATMGAGASTQLDSQLDQLVKEGLQQGAQEKDVLLEASKRIQDRLAKLPQQAGKEQEAASKLQTLWAGGRETVIVELGAKDLKRRGSPKPLEEVEQIILILDPRGDIFRFYCTEDVETRKTVRMDEILTTEVLNKTIAFYLLPSLTSSPEALLGVEWLPAGISATFGMVIDDAMEVCVLRTDEYMVHGDSLLVQMVDDGKLVCPAEEAQSMLRMFSPCDSLLGDNMSSWNHIIISYGFEYGQFCEFQEALPESRLQSILRSPGSRGLSRKALPAPEKDKAAPARVVFQQNASPMFVAFSNSAATRYSKQLGSSGTRVLLFGRQQYGHLGKWLTARSKVEEEIRKAKEEKEEEGEQAEDIPVPDLPLPPAELEEFFGDHVYPILILEPEDMSFSMMKRDNPDGTYDCFRASAATEYMAAFQEVCIQKGLDRSICVLGVGQDFDSFAQNGAFVEFLSYLMDKSRQSWPMILVTEDEVAQAAGLFTRVKHPQENVTAILPHMGQGSTLRSCIPVIYTLPSALGQAGVAKCKPLQLFGVI